MDLAALVLGFTAWAETITGAYGYLGVFLVTLLGNLSVFLPLPSFAVVFAMGAVLNPWLVGIAAGLGSGLGELSSYVIGHAGHRAFKGKENKSIQKLQKWIHRRGFFPVIVFVAATPIPLDDLIAILAGVARYDVRKFLAASILGKTILSLALAFGGAYAMDWVLVYLGG